MSVTAYFTTFIVGGTFLIVLVSARRFIWNVVSSIPGQLVRLLRWVLGEHYGRQVENGVAAGMQAYDAYNGIRLGVWMEDQTHERFEMVRTELGYPTPPYDAADSDPGCAMASGTAPTPCGSTFTHNETCPSAARPDPS